MCYCSNLESTFFITEVVTIWIKSKLIRFQSQYIFLIHVFFLDKYIGQENRVERQTL